MFDSGVFREKNNSANAMVKQHFVRAIERGIRRDRPNTEKKRYVCQVTFDMRVVLVRNQGGAPRFIPVSVRGDRGVAKVPHEL